MIVLCNPVATTIGYPVVLSLMLWCKPSDNISKTGLLSCLNYQVYWKCIYFTDDVQVLNNSFVVKKFKLAFFLGCSWFNKWKMNSMIILCDMFIKVLIALNSSDSLKNGKHICNLCRQYYYGSLTKQKDYCNCMFKC